MRWEWAEYFACSDQEEEIQERIRAGISMNDVRRGDRERQMVSSLEDEPLHGSVRIMSAWNIECAVSRLRCQSTFILILLIVA